jgi:hypothetical protein
MKLILSVFVLVAIFAGVNAQGDPCGNFTTCAECVANSQCGFCADPYNPYCASGDSFGPGGNVSECSAFWNFGFCAGAACNSYTVCEPCSQAPDCVWCTGAGTTGAANLCTELDSATTACDTAAGEFFYGQCDIAGIYCEDGFVPVEGVCLQCPPTTIDRGNPNFRACLGRGKCGINFAVNDPSTVITVCRCGSIPDQAGGDRVVFAGAFCQTGSKDQGAFVGIADSNSNVNANIGKGKPTRKRTAAALSDGDFQVVLSPGTIPAGVTGVFAFRRLELADDGSTAEIGVVNPADADLSGFSWSSAFKSMGFFADLNSAATGAAIDPFGAPVLLTFDYTANGFDDDQAANIFLFGFPTTVTDGVWTSNLDICGAATARTLDVSAKTLTVTLCRPGFQYQFFLAEDADTPEPETFTSTEPDTTSSTGDDDDDDDDTSTDNDTTDVSAASSVQTSTALSVVFAVIAIVALAL